jgi:hypothetical protein
MKNIGVITVAVMWVALLVFLHFSIKAEDGGALFVFIVLLAMMYSLASLILNKDKISAKALKEFRDAFQSED